MCISVCPSCMYINYMCAWCPQESKDKVKSPDYGGL